MNRKNNDFLNTVGVVFINAGSEIKELDTEEHEAFHPRGESGSNGTAKHL